MDRRDFLLSTGALAAASVLPGLASAAGKEYELPKLPYAFDALEPHIDAKTMEIHHDRHHKAYVDNLNKALAKTEFEGKPILELLAGIDKLPEALRMPVRNNAGGHYNHTLFWQCMAKNGGKPAGELLKAIEAGFKSVEGLQGAVKDAGLKRFGSGWAWVVIDKGGLKVTSSSNQDNPVMEGGVPLFGLDVWEHAYYLKYENKRPDYIDAWFKVVNWEFLNERYKTLTKA